MIQKILKLDESISYKLRVAETPGLLRTLANFIGHTGDSWYWGILLVLVIVVAPPIYKFWAIVSLLAVGVGASLVLAIKFTIRRQRPAGDMGEIYRKTDPHSFPSGHAVRSIMLGVIALGIAPAWLGMTLMIWAPLVGLARIAIGVHYVSDVLVGWVLGVLFGWGVIALANWLPGLLF